MTPTLLRTVTDAPARRHLCPNADLGPADVMPGQVWSNDTDQPDHVHRWSVVAVDRRKGEALVRRGLDGRPRHRGAGCIDRRVSLGALLAYWTRQP